MRYKITIEYDGTNLLGWQEQLDGPSVQSYLQQALSCFTPVNDNEQPMAPLNTSSTISPINASSTTSPLNVKGRLGGVYASPKLCENEDASSGEHPQKTNAISDNDFSESYDGGSTERRPAAYIEVREDASTERRF